MRTSFLSELTMKKLKVDKQSIKGEKQNLIFGSRNSRVSWTVSRLFQLLTFWTRRENPSISLERASSLTSRNIVYFSLFHVV